MECSSLFLQKLCDEGEDVECASLFLQKLYDEEKDVEYASISEKKDISRLFFNFA